MSDDVVYCATLPAVMTGGGTVITPEELDMLTRDPETLRNKPLYRWQPQQLDRLSSAINAKEKELSTERTSLSKASWTFTQQVAKFSFTAGKRLSDAEQGLVAELEPDEVGKRFLAVAQPRLQQARAEVGHGGAKSCQLGSIGYRTLLSLN